MLTNEKGFTMIELLLVLFTVFLISSIILSIGTKWTAYSEEDIALQSIVTTMYSLQAYSMAHQVNTRLTFQSTEDHRMAYVASVPGYYEISRNILPEGMRLATSSNLMQVEFYADGAIARFGSIYFHTNNGLRRITVQIARGRVIISESKRIFLARSHPNSGHYYGRFWNITSPWNQFI